MTRRALVISFVAVACFLFLVIQGLDSFLTHRCTRYPPGFTHRGWKRITNGMPADVVYTLVGAPFVTNDYGNSELWMYAFGNNTPLFRKHNLSLSNGVVVDKTEFLYFD